jgi:predicted DNA-binding transcriptional regulator AlpA
MHQDIQDQRSTADIRFNDPAPPIRMLSMAQVEAKVGLKRTKIYGLMDSRDFPQSYSIGGGRAMRFVESEIDQWLLDQIQRSRTELHIRAKVCVKSPAKGGV